MRVVLGAETNQALGLGQYAIDFMSDEAGKRGEPDQKVLDRTRLFHTDSLLCGASALALGTNAPTLLRAEALAEQGARHSALDYLTAMAVRTERVRLGTMLTPLPWRRPWKLAAQVATLDQLSNGRAVIGLDTHWLKGCSLAVKRAAGVFGRELLVGIIERQPQNRIIG